MFRHCHEDGLDKATESSGDGGDGHATMFALIKPEELVDQTEQGLHGDDDDLRWLSLTSSFEDEGSTSKMFGPLFDDRLAYTCHRCWSDTTQQAIQDCLDVRAKYSVPMWMGESGENTDGWIDAFRRLFESQNIGWCFWPCKKMDAKSCMVTFDRPEGYSLIVEYANADRATFEAKRKARPDSEKVRKALAGFLKNCRCDRTKVNYGYLRALVCGRPWVGVSGEWVHEPPDVTRDPRHDKSMTLVRRALATLSTETFTA